MSNIERLYGEGAYEDCNGRIYGRCSACGQVVVLNKRIFGSLHVCLSEDEIAAKKELHTEKRRKA